jgi:hypothetical protein
MSGSNAWIRAAWALSFAMGLALSAVRCSGGASCLRNSDCPGDKVCIQGACALPPVEDAGADADAAPDARPDSGPEAGGSGAVGGTGPGGAGEGGAPAQ